MGSFETFFAHRINQIAYRNGANIDFENDLEGQITIGKSWSYGLEFSLKKQAGNFQGWLSYTLSRTRDRFAKINDGRAFEANQDRPHSVSLVGIWEVRKGFSLSASWSYLSGKLVTVPIGKYEVNEQIIDVYGNRNNYRLNDHHRADISATWRKEKDNGLKQSWTVALYNVYLHRNPEYLYIDPIENTAQEITLFGLIPAVTYNFEF
jgi:outer membrane receptor protein involved in Fe transport